jgi:hypothetical protein
MWWRFKLHSKKRKQYLLPCVPICLSSIGFFKEGTPMWITIGWIILGLGLLLAFFILYISDIPPREVSLKNSRLVWALWFTGGNHINLLKDYKGTMKILVLDPNSSAFDENFEITKGFKSHSVKEIQEITKIANCKGIPLKWYDKLEGKSFTLYDKKDNGEPTSKEAYCVYQIPEPGLSGLDRKSHKINKNSHDFSDFIKIFNNTWNCHSEYPKLQLNGEYEVEKKSEDKQTK